MFMSSGHCHQEFNTAPLRQAMVECATIQVYFLPFVAFKLSSTIQGAEGRRRQFHAPSEEFCFSIQGSVSPEAQDHSRGLTLIP